MKSIDKYKEIQRSKEAAVLSIGLFAFLSLAMMIKAIIDFSLLNLLALLFSIGVFIQAVLALRALNKLAKLLFKKVSVAGSLYVPKPILYSAVYWYVPKYS